METLEKAEVKEELTIKETKELVLGLIELAALFGQAMKDGLTASDAVVVWEKIKASPELSEKLLQAYNDIEKVPSEVKDITLAEGFEMGLAVLPAIGKLLAAVKK